RDPRPKSENLSTGRSRLRAASTQGPADQSLQDRHPQEAPIHCPHLRLVIGCDFLHGSWTSVAGCRHLADSLADAGSRAKVDRAEGGAHAEDSAGYRDELDSPREGPASRPLPPEMDLPQPLASPRAR